MAKVLASRISLPDGKLDTWAISVIDSWSNFSIRYNNPKARGVVNSISGVKNWIIGGFEKILSCDTSEPEE